MFSSGSSYTDLKISCALPLGFPAPSWNVKRSRRRCCVNALSDITPCSLQTCVYLCFPPRLSFPRLSVLTYTYKCTRTQTGYGCCNTAQVFGGLPFCSSPLVLICSPLFSICSDVHAVVLSCQTLHAHCTFISLILLFGSDVALFFECLQYSN